MIDSTSTELPDRLRIIVLGPLPPPYGGPEVMTKNLLDGLKQHKNIVITHINIQVSRSLAEKGGKYQVRKSLRAFVQVMMLLNMLIKFKPDIVYMPLTNSPSFLGFLRDSLFMIPTLLGGKKVVIRLHGGYYFYAHTKGVRRFFVQYLLSHVCLALVQGERLRDTFNGMIPPERIVVVPNGLNSRLFDDARQRKVRVSDQRSNMKRILFVGLMCQEKGFQDIIAAVSLVPDAKFVFMGEWPTEKDKKETLEFLKDNNLIDRVEFAGVVSGSQKYDVFASSDIFVFPTNFIYEGHAVCSVEALAAGLPIICTDHGALNESVKDSWNGYFVPYADPVALAQKINFLINDDALIEEMSKRSRLLYEQRFTIDCFIKNWVDGIQKCMDR